MSQSLRLPPAPLLCSALFSLCPMPPPPSPAMCRALTAPRRPFVHHVLLVHPARRSPDHAGLSSLCRAALPSARTALRRCSPLLQPCQHHLLLLVVTTRCSPVNRRSSSPRCLLPHAPRCPRHCPSSAPAITHWALSSTRSTSWSSQCTSSYIPAPTFPRPFLFPTTAPHRTSSVASGRRRQPPTLFPIPDPMLLEHRRDPLVLPSPPNLALCTGTTGPLCR
jgi:hypothetical protein